MPHRVLFGVSALLALASWACIAIFGAALNNGTTDSMGWCLWAYVILWGVSAGFSAQCFYALWGTELFPTRYRGGAQGIMFFLVRAALGIWSLVGVGAIMGDISTNPAGVFPAALIMCAVLVVSLVVGVAWCPDTQGKTLDQITEERYGKLQSRFMHARAHRPGMRVSRCVCSGREGRVLCNRAGGAIVLGRICARRAGGLQPPAHPGAAASSGMLRFIARTRGAHKGRKIPGPCVTACPYPQW